jgi:hypothetical protein
MILSMPSTISSAVSVTRLIQIWGSEIQSIPGGSPVARPASTPRRLEKPLFFQAGAGPWVTSPPRLHLPAGF